MKVIESHICSCDIMLELSYQETFPDLDRSFVKACSELISTPTVSLYLGEYQEGGQTPLLHTYHNEQAVKLAGETVVFPIKLTSGQVISLVARNEPSKKQLSELFQIIALYVNQHEHLSRSNKDFLTDLKNRRAFDLEYAKLIQSQHTKNDQHTLAVLDIDHFKQVNDNFGHIVGDETLIAMANILKGFFEKDDFIYRFGGEEFIILLHKTEQAEAIEILESLRKRVEQHQFAQVGHLTISTGLVSLEKNFDSGILFGRADAALYKAKESGRNCTKSYEQLLETNQISPIESREGTVDLF